MALIDPHPLDQLAVFIRERQCVLYYDHDRAEWGLAYEDNSDTLTDETLAELLPVIERVWH